MNHALYFPDAPLLGTAGRRVSLARAKYLRMTENRLNDHATDERTLDRIIADVTRPAAEVNGAALARLLTVDPASTVEGDPIRLRNGQDDAGARMADGDCDGME